MNVQRVCAEPFGGPYVIGSTLTKTHELLYVRVIGLLNVFAATVGNGEEVVQHCADPDPVIVLDQVFLMPTTVETDSGLTRCTALDEPDGLIGVSAPLLQPAKIALEIIAAIAKWKG